MHCTLQCAVPARSLVHGWHVNSVRLLVSISYVPQPATGLIAVHYRVLALACVCVHLGFIW